jgi:hypothetical protein
VKAKAGDRLLLGAVAVGALRTGEALTWEPLQTPTQADRIAQGLVSEVFFPTKYTVHQVKPLPHR